MEPQDNDTFFEGAEKVLEVTFSSKEQFNHKMNLRKIPREKIEELLDAVKCSILKQKKAEYFDAYVLSESSLFIYESRFILKTCGTTTSLMALPKLIELVSRFTTLTDIKEVFYSRKNFIRPELQLGPHKNFDSEVKYLNKYFTSGKSLCLGDLKDDCWFIYSEMAPELPFNIVPRYQLTRNAPDQTFEIIMQELDQQKMIMFTQKGSLSSEEATIKSGINQLLPDMIVDDYLFIPCGYSMNGIIKGRYYCTIHITPQPGCSYLSFETNYPLETVKDLVLKLVDMFRPGKFQAMLMYNSFARVKKDPFNFTISNFFRYNIESSRIQAYEVDYVKFCNKFPS